MLYFVAFGTVNTVTFNTPVDVLGMVKGPSVEVGSVSPCAVTPVTATQYGLVEASAPPVVPTVTSGGGGVQMLSLMLMSQFSSISLSARSNCAVRMERRSPSNCLPRQIDWNVSLFCRP